MQSIRSPKFQVDAMWSAEYLGVNGRSNGTTIEIPSASPTREACGLNNLKPGCHYPRGTVLFAEGERPRGVHVLCEGRAKVSIASAEGKTLLVRIAQPGELLGMNATLTGEGHGETVETLESCRVDFIEREDFLSLLDGDGKACLGVAHALSRQLCGLVEHTRMLFLSHSAAEKLARLLVRWCDEHGRPTARGILIDSGLTHEEIAQMICTSRETVTRVLAEFKRKNIVTLAGKALFVRNREALASLAGS